MPSPLIVVLYSALWSRKSIAYLMYLASSHVFITRIGYFQGRLRFGAPPFLPPIFEAQDF